MLIIKDSNRKVYEWRVGEPLPKMKGPVINFQADGDELRAILAALDPTRITFSEYQERHGRGLSKSRARKETKERAFKGEHPSCDHPKSRCTSPLHCCWHGELTNGQKGG